MHYLRILMEGGSDAGIHSLFTKYGRGEYLGPVCDVDVGKNIKYKASIEYAGVFGLLTAMSGGDLNVEGTVFAKDDFRDVLSSLGIDFKDKSKVKQSYYVAEVKGTYPSDAMAKFYDAVPYATVLFTIKGGKSQMKCKKKPPKPGKDKILDFCSGTIDKSVLDKMMEDIFFDVKGFTKAKCENTYVIKELVVPAGVEPAQARIDAKRVGEIVRKVNTDGVEKVSKVKLDI